MEEDSIIGKYHVVGYHLAISPTNYTIELEDAGQGHIMMTSEFDVAPGTGCCIPFCCLFPSCMKRKEVIDQFRLEDDQLILEHSTAFHGLITCLEKGKTFRVIKLDVVSRHYVILTNPKEIFILSPEDISPSDEDRTQIKAAIAATDLALVKLSLIFL